VNPFGLLGGLCSLSLFLAHGALFLCLKTEGDVLARAERVALVARYVAFVLLILMFATFPVATENATLSKVLRLTTLLLYAVPAWLVRQKKMGWSFAFSSLTLVFFVATVFQGMFPNVFMSTLNPEFNLHIYNASSSPYTLKIMSYVALIFVPIVLVYQGWTYWIFRKRITRNTKVVY
jgi:cytochrome d ubiquinol oxidase subunit II